MLHSIIWGEDQRIEKSKLLSVMSLVEKQIWVCGFLIFMSEAKNSPQYVELTVRKV